jgi:hypothetical protein
MVPDISLTHSVSTKTWCLKVEYACHYWYSNQVLLIPALNKRLKYKRIKNIEK